MSVNENVVRVEEYEFPLDRRYYRGRDAHLWVKREGDRFRIGMDQFMAETAGYLNYLEVTSPELSEGEAFGHFESAKFVSKLYAPFDGEVVEVNEAAERDPRTVNQDPYGTWLVEVRVSGEVDASDLVRDAEELETWIRDEIASLD